MFINVGRFRVNLQLFPCLITLLVVPFLIALGCWQLDRAALKQQREIKLQSAQFAPKLSLLNLPEAFAKWNDYLVTVTGYFVKDKLWLIENRIVDNKLGFDVVAILQTDDYPLPIAINLGWVPANIERNLIKPIVLPTGKVTFDAVFRLVSDNPFMSELVLGDNYPKRVQQLSPEDLSIDINMPLARFKLLIDYEQSIGFKPHWQNITMRAEKHIGYAVQWFLLAFAFVILMLWRALEICPKKPVKKQ